MNNKQELYENWLLEEKNAQIIGWDFSYIEDRYSEEDDLPWDYKEIINKYLSKDMNLLDMETGGGEFLLSLNHPYENTSAIEGYKPNVDYCNKILKPLGIDFIEAEGEDILPFDDNSFDIVTNRHGSYNAKEIRRVLKENGLFITQQVGAENDRELVELLLPENKEVAFPELYLNKMKKEFINNEFEILEEGEVFNPIKFYDVGALVWFAKIIEWEFPGFTVDKSINELYKAQDIIDKEKEIKGRIHRFYLVARKI